MSFIYKTILRAENKDFDYVKNRHNSRLSSVIAIDRKTREGCDHVCRLDNRTGEVAFIDHNRFKSSTINKLLTAIANL